MPLKNDFNSSFDVLIFSIILQGGNLNPILSTFAYAKDCSYHNLPPKYDVSMEYLHPGHLQIQSRCVLMKYFDLGGPQLQHRWGGYGFGGNLTR